MRLVSTGRPGNLQCLRPARRVDGGPALGVRSPSRAARVSGEVVRGPNVSKDMDTPHRDQGAIDLTVMPEGSRSLKVERWDSDEVRQTAVESQVSIRHRALELQRPIRLRLSLAAC